MIHSLCFLSSEWFRSTVILEFILMYSIMNSKSHLNPYIGFDLCILYTLLTSINNNFFRDVSGFNMQTTKCNIIVYLLIHRLLYYILSVFKAWFCYIYYCFEFNITCRCFSCIHEIFLCDYIFHSHIDLFIWLCRSFLSD